MHFWKRDSPARSRSTILKDKIRRVAPAPEPAQGYFHHPRPVYASTQPELTRDAFVPSPGPAPRPAFSRSSPSLDKSHVEGPRCAERYQHRPLPALPVGVPPHRSPSRVRSTSRSDSRVEIPHRCDSRAAAASSRRCSRVVEEALPVSPRDMPLSPGLAQLKCLPSLPEDASPTLLGSPAEAPHEVEPKERNSPSPVPPSVADVDSRPPSSQSHGQGSAGTVTNTAQPSSAATSLTTVPASNDNILPGTVYVTDLQHDEKLSGMSKIAEYGKTLAQLDRPRKKASLIREWLDFIDAGRRDTIRV